MKLIDGRSLARARLTELKREVKKLGGTPGLGVVLIGSDTASHIYVGRKEKAAKRAGIHFDKRLFFAGTDEKTILDTIRELNDDPAIHGIVVQLPVPAPLDENRLIQAIDPAKDADGFHPDTIKRLLNGDDVPMPPLIHSIVALIESTGAALSGKQVVLAAKSPVFTEPFQYMVEQRGARLSCASTPGEAHGLLKSGDIVVTALGIPRWITGNMLQDGVVVIDVGITEMEDGTVAGDVDMPSTSQHDGWLTPVPGGVGPMTVVLLLENTVEAYRRLRG